MNDRELNERITEQLISIPNELREAEILLETGKQTLKDLQQNLEDAELNVELSAIIDGKNAEERRRQLKEALLDSPNVQAAKSVIRAHESELITFEANVKAISRNFRACLALAELQAARMNLLAKYETKINQERI